MRTGLIDEVRRVIDAAQAVLNAADQKFALTEARERLDGPLRVAIAGKVKAGKSTLLNALVGQQVAPTDAGECTRIVTWYRNSHRYQVMLHPRQGEPAELRYRHNGGGLEIDLGQWTPDQVKRIEVAWPSTKLQAITLIDTPGLASLSAEVSARTLEFLGPQESLSGADAVIYLMRHLHENDLRFLEAFRDEEGRENRAPIHRLGVLSRADEIGGCTASSMDAAQRVAARWRTDSRLRQLCQTVIPVAGLLAQAATTLREDEFLSLRDLASLPGHELEAVLLSADRVRYRPISGDVAAEARRSLLDRMGLLGIRLAVGWIAAGTVTSSPELATALVRASGLEQLRDSLTRQFEFRAQVLKARSGLQAVEQALGTQDDAPAHRLRREVQRIELGAHEIAEIDLLSRLRSDALEVPEEYVSEAERLLGGEGPEPALRLGCPGATPAEELRIAAIEAATKYRRLAVHPLASRSVSDLADAVVRTCEGLIADLASPGGAS